MCRYYKYVSNSHSSKPLWLTGYWYSWLFFGKKIQIWIRMHKTLFIILFLRYCHTYIFQNRCTYSNHYFLQEPVNFSVLFISQAAPQTSCKELYKLKGKVKGLKSLVRFKVLAPALCTELGVACYKEFTILNSLLCYCISAFCY